MLLGLLLLAGLCWASSGCTPTINGPAFSLNTTVQQPPCQCDCVVKSSGRVEPAR